MKKAETESRAGTAAPGQGPHMEVKAALSGLLGRVQRLSVRDQSEAPGTGIPFGHARPQIHRDCPARRSPAAPNPTRRTRRRLPPICARGDDDGLRGLTVEEKALSTAVAADGGYLVDPQTAAQIVGVLRSSASIRSIANVVSVEATRLRRAGRPHRHRRRLGDRDRGAHRDRHAAGRPDLDPAARAVGAAEGLAAAARRQRLRRRGLAGAADRRQVQPRRGGGLHLGRRRRQADGVPDLSRGRQRALRLGLARLCADRHRRRFQRRRSGRRRRRPGLCAGRALPRQRAPS